MIRKVVFNFSIQQKVVQNSVDGIILNRRNRFEQIQKIEEQKQKNVQLNVDAYTQAIIQLDLYMDHTCVESQKVDSLFNYYEVSFRRNMNILHLRDFKQEHKIQNWPALRVYNSFYPMQIIQGSQNIENYMLENQYIVKNLVGQNSVWAKQGIQFAHTVREQLDLLFQSPVLTFQNLFKSTPETYRANQKSAIILKALRLTFQKILCTSFSNMIKIFKDKQSYKKSKEQFLLKMKEWDERLNNQSFHGGDSPDDADFEMYAVLKSKYNSKTFQRFLDKKLSQKSSSWFLRMQLKCKYELREYIQ